MALQVRRPTCSRHPEQQESASCSICGKGICRECIDEFGYFCSEECCEKSKQTITPQERADAQESMAKYQRGMKMFKMAVMLVVLAGVVAAGYFAYQHFFDKAGRVVWQWSTEDDITTVNVLGNKGSEALVLMDAKIYRFDLPSGKIISESENLDLAGLMNFKLVGDRIVGWSSNRFFSCDLNGKNAKNVICSEIGFGLPVFNDTYDKAWFISAKYGGKESTTFKLGTVDLTTGKESIDPLSGTASVRLVGCHGNAPVLLLNVQSARRNNRKGGWYIQAKKSGKKMLLPLPAQPEFGPTLQKGWLTFRLGGKLQVISLDQDKDFSFPIPVDDEYFSDPGYVIRDDELWILFAKGTVCYDLNDGKALWKSKLAIDEGSMVFSRNRVIVNGGRSEQASIDLAALPGGNQVGDDLLKDLSGGENTKLNRETIVPVLAAINRKTGKIEWSVEHVRGEMVADAEHIAFVMDTAVTGFNPLGSAESTLYVRQFNVNSGKEIVERQSKEIKSIGDSFLVGDYVLNVYNTGEPKFVGGELKRVGGKTGMFAIKLR